MSSDNKTTHRVLCVNCGKEMCIPATTLSEARLTLYCDACTKLLKLPGASILDVLPPPRVEAPLSDNTADKPQLKPDNTHSTASDGNQSGTHSVVVKHIEVTLDGSKTVSTRITMFEKRAPEIQRVVHEFYDKSYDKSLKEVFSYKEDQLTFDLTETYTDGGKALQGSSLPPDEAK